MAEDDADSVWLTEDQPPTVADYKRLRTLDIMDNGPAWRLRVACGGNEVSVGNVAPLSRIISGGPADVGHVVGVCHCGLYHFNA